MKEQKKSSKAAPKRREPGARAKRNLQPQKAPHAQPRKHAPSEKMPTHQEQEVVYLAPKPFSRARLALHLATVVAVVLALMLGLSVFFKVENIQVSGCEKYTEWEVLQASEILEGDQLLSLNRAKAAGKIVAAMPYVKSVRIGITLPDTVIIQVVESPVVYAVCTIDETWWLIDSSGKVVESVSAESAKSHTQLLGVRIENPVVGQQAQPYQEQQEQTDADGNVIPVTVTASQRLSAALEIAVALESYDVIGDIATINVSDLYAIEMWYGTRYRVLLGNTDTIDEKVRCMKGAIDGYAVSDPYASGTLDVSDLSWINFQSFEE